MDLWNLAAKIEFLPDTAINSCGDDYAGNRTSDIASEGIFTLNLVLLTAAGSRIVSLVVRTLRFRF